ncbi:MAG: UDP-2,3-diacylglucosamine diphosphatase [Bacteroidia bacterium]|nr:UDP-2,3-diacylglucosamine diphosphatase [Bacteroidia bacterium]
MNYYFLSDFHLGVPNLVKSQEREKRIVAFLDEIKSDAKAVFLVGDLFDFWFEYKYTIPKGYVRLLGKLAEMVDAGIEVHVFTGNHDMWMFGYLESEIGVKLHKKPIFLTLNNKNFMIGHGDGLGPGDHGYKLIKKVFSNPVCQWLFARLHPNFSFGLANYWSKRSRLANGDSDEVYTGDENEYLVQFTRNFPQDKNIHYFIFGHRHLPLNMPVHNNSRYINLGDWIRYQSYAKWDGTQLTLLYHPKS